MTNPKTITATLHGEDTYILTNEEGAELNAQIRFTLQGYIILGGDAAASHEYFTTLEEAVKKAPHGTVKSTFKLGRITH